MSGAARPAGNDTAPPAGWESSDRAAMLAIREGRVPADRAAAGPWAGTADAEPVYEFARWLDNLDAPDALETRRSTSLDDVIRRARRALLAAAGPRASGAGDDTAPPALRHAVAEVMGNVSASWRVSPPEMNTVRSESTEVTHALWAQVAEDVDAWTESWLAAHPVTPAGPRAGDTAPDDEHCRHGRLGDSCLDCASYAVAERDAARRTVVDLQWRLDETQAELADARSEAAALRAAGDALADDVQAMLTGPVPRPGEWWSRLAPQVDAWRSATGSGAGYWTETTDQRPWAAPPGEPVCREVYSGELWSPRPCIQVRGHAAGCSDQYGRTWSAAGSPITDGGEQT